MRCALIIALCSVGLAACTAIIGLRDDYTLAPDGGDDATMDVAQPDTSTSADAVSLVQSKWVGTANGNGVTLSLASAMRPGDLVVVAVGWQGSATATISDPMSDAYSSVAPDAASIGSVYQQIFYLVVDAGGSTSINVSTSVGVQFLDVRMAEYAGPKSFVSYGVNAAAGQVYNVSASGDPGEVFVAAGIADHPILATSDGGFAVRITTPPPFFDILQDRIADAAANYTATATLEAGGNAVFQLAAFK